MIKAAFFDMDGTLLSHKSKQVPPSARRALDQLREKGILCVLATGRQMVELDKLPSADLEFDAYITLNGQLILDRERNVLSAVPITGPAKDYFLDCFRQNRFPILLVERDRVYLNYVNDHVRAVQESISSEVPDLGVYEGGEIYQVCAYLKDDEEHLIAPVAGECVATRWNMGGLDIIARGGGKVPGIMKYLEHMGIAREETIAFGDGENDIQMLRFAGIGVAMGNAVEEAKAAADYVTADIDDDGIEKAMKHFGLME